MNVVLSKIERLPDDALPAVARAYDLIKGRRASQLDTLAMLNEELVRLGTAPISRSAFSRWVQRIRNGEISRPR